MLTAAYPQSSRDDLSALPLGERDSRLLGLRASLFGTYLQSVVACPACGTQLEFTLDTRDLIGSPTSQDSAPLSVTAGDTSLSVRRVNSRDLAAISGSVDVQAARRLLCEQCVLQATRDGNVIPAANLSAAAVEEVASALATADPRAELQIDLRCAACQHRCQPVFDVVSFLWTEIDLLVRRLLHEVHALAWAYGWHEADVLAMSNARRQFYLEMVR